jgi:F-box/leucine-rich repeat protein 10/11
LDTPVDVIGKNRYTFSYRFTCGYIVENLCHKPLDVATQAEQPGWNMAKWADYFHSDDRDRIRNVISLEISGTKFAERIRRPKLVR